MVAAKSLIRHDYNGFLLSELNVRELEKYMLEYIDNPDLIELHAKRNKRLAISQSFPFRANQWNKIFKNN